MTTTTPTGKKRKKPSAQAVHLTDRDLLLLQRACRYGCLTVPLLQATVAVNPTTGNRLHASGIYAQVERLVREGYLEDLRTGPSNVCRPRHIQALLVPTRKGYDLAGTGLAYKRPALGTLIHTLAVAEMGLQHEMKGWTVATDRQIRSEIQSWRSEVARARKAKEPLPPIPDEAAWIMTAEGTGTEAGGVFSGMRGPRTHAPDLVVTDADGDRCAIEVELSAKNDRDLSSVMATFAAATKYRTVYYFIPDRTLAVTVAKAAERAAVPITVKKFAPMYWVN